MSFNTAMSLVNTTASTVATVVSLSQADTVRDLETIVIETGTAELARRGGATYWNNQPFFLTVRVKDKQTDAEINGMVNRLVKALNDMRDSSGMVRLLLPIGIEPQPMDKNLRSTVVTATMQWQE